MGSAVGALAMGSAVMVGASLIAATPAVSAPEQAKTQLNDVAVRLAANSIANMPTNLIRMMLDMPKNQLSGLEAATASLELSGNWWIYTPTNVLGWDQADWAKAFGFTSMFTPIPEVAKAQADQLNAIMTRNFPMTPDCTGSPGPCSNPFYFTKYFSTPPWQAMFGYSYKFGPVYNTLTGEEMPWSNQTLTYDPLGPGKALWEALTKEPDPNWTYERPYLIDQIAAGKAFWKAIWNSFNPFVKGTYCLPCQLVVPGAPSSLPVIQIFGNYYTYLDLGQKFTEQDWAAAHPGVPMPAHVETLSLWTPAAWQRIGKDASTWFKWILGKGPAPQTDYGQPGQMLPEVPGWDTEIEQGLGAALAAKVLTINGTAGLGVDQDLNGAVCDGSLGACENLPYTHWMDEFSIQDGLTKLTAALADPESGPVTVYGYSAGAVIATRWLNNYAKASAMAQALGQDDVEGAPSADDLHFILAGNPDRKYGGSRPSWYLERPTANNTKYTVLDVARQYDFAADFPDNPFNLLAMMNALSAYVVVHPYYTDVDLNDPNNVVFQEGNTTYVLVPTENLPMLHGLRQMGWNKLADQLQKMWKPIIDKAYKRNYPNVITDPVAAQEAVDRAKAGLPPLDAGGGAGLRSAAVPSGDQAGLTLTDSQVGGDNRPATTDEVSTDSEVTAGDDATTGDQVTAGDEATGGDETADEAGADETTADETTADETTADETTADEAGADDEATNTDDSSAADAASEGGSSTDSYVGRHRAAEPSSNQDSGSDAGSAASSSNQASADKAA